MRYFKISQHHAGLSTSILEFFSVLWGVKANGCLVLKLWNQPSVSFTPVEEMVQVLGYTDNCSINVSLS
jgi:hypothetical protein